VASRATTSVLPARSKTCSPGRGSASATTRGAHAAKTAETSARSMYQRHFQPPAIAPGHSWSLFTVGNSVRRTRWR
jgi:hypothetical protein